MCCTNTGVGEVPNERSFVVLLDDGEYSIYVNDESNVIRH